MIVLDTNVASEWMRPRPSDAVIEWMARQTPTNLYCGIDVINPWLSGPVLRGNSRRAPCRRNARKILRLSAIARARGWSVATRNVRDFEGCGIDVSTRLRDYPQAYRRVEYHQRQHRILPPQRQRMTRRAPHRYHVRDIHRHDVPDDYRAH